MCTCTCILQNYNNNIDMHKGGLFSKYILHFAFLKDLILLILLACFILHVTFMSLGNLFIYDTCQLLFKLRKLKYK